jgi:hypothetical protein
VNQRTREAFIDRIAQPAHVHVGDVGLRIEVQVPDAFQQHGAGDDLPGPPHQELQQLEFLGGEVDVLAGARDFASQQVEFQVRHFEATGFRQRGAAPAECFDARQQLGERERLGEIVVAAHFESVHPIIDGAERRQNQHRRAIVALAQGSDDRQAVQMRQLAIGNDHVVIALRGLIEAIAAVRAVLGGVAAFAQPFHQIFGRLQVVFDEQQFHSGLATRINSGSRRGCGRVPRNTQPHRPPTEHTRFSLLEPARRSAPRHARSAARRSCPWSSWRHCAGRRWISPPCRSRRE